MQATPSSRAPPCEWNMILWYQIPFLPVRSALLVAETLYFIRPFSCILSYRLQTPLAIKDEPELLSIRYSRSSERRPVRQCKRTNENLESILF